MPPPPARPAQETPAVHRAGSAAAMRRQIEPRMTSATVTGTTHLVRPDAEGCLMRGTEGATLTHGTVIQIDLAHPMFSPRGPNQEDPLSEREDRNAADGAHAWPVPSSNPSASIRPRCMRTTRWQASWRRTAASGSSMNSPAIYPGDHGHDRRGARPTEGFRHASGQGRGIAGPGAAAGRSARPGHHRRYAISGVAELRVHRRERTPARQAGLPSGPSAQISVITCSAGKRDFGSLALKSSALL